MEHCLRRLRQSEVQGRIGLRATYRQLPGLCIMCQYVYSKLSGLVLTPSIKGWVHVQNTLGGRLMDTVVSPGLTGTVTVPLGRSKTAETIRN